MIKSIMQRKKVQWERLSPSRVAHQHRKRHATQLLFTLSQRLCSAALLETQADRPRTVHDDRSSCSLCQHEIREGVRNASDFESPQEHPGPLAGGWTFVQSRCHFFVSFLQCLIRAGNSWLLRQWSTIMILSSISPPRLHGLFVHSNFQRVSSIEVPCLSLESPSLHCKKGKTQLQAIPKFAVGASCNRKQAMQWRSRK